MSAAKLWPPMVLHHSLSEVISHMDMKCLVLKIFSPTMWK
uniref:Uncharacterized protein n=1 Tax=Arundo donax TaxID=35708 RepID=A0A0A9FJX3_ARUDO